MTDRKSARPIQLELQGWCHGPQSQLGQSVPCTSSHRHPSDGVTHRKSARPNQLPGATDREVSSDNPFDAPPLTDIHHPSLTLESKLSTYSLLPYSDPPTTACAHPCRRPLVEFVGANKNINHMKGPQPNHLDLGVCSLQAIWQRTLDQSTHVATGMVRPCVQRKALAELAVAGNRCETPGK